MGTIAYQRVVDLSHCIHPEIPLWQGDPAVEFEAVAEISSEGYYLRRFAIGEHSATHMNAPRSFFADGIGIDQYAAESLVVPAVVIDGRSQAATHPDYGLTIADVLNWETQHDKIPAGSVVLFYTGWQEKWQHPSLFMNWDADGNAHFPGFSAAATQFLLAERAIAGVGIDTHGVDPAVDPTFATNRAVLARAGIVLENLTNLDQLPPVGTTLAIGLLRLQGGSGSPVSVLAFIP
ncbi:MAG TPA: cyclase family protein [Microcoleaceae cyanobacterium]|jgi:kynurenine formamidase